MTEQEEPKQTPEEPTKAERSDEETVGDLARAGQKAIAEGKDPTQAMQAEAQRLELTDDDIERIGEKLFGKFKEAGAFDPPPEPVTGPPAPPEAPTPSQGGTVEAQPTPEPKKNFAQKVVGL